MRSLSGAKCSTRSKIPHMQQLVDFWYRSSAWYHQDFEEESISSTLLDMG